MCRKCAVLIFNIIFLIKVLIIKVSVSSVSPLGKKKTQPCTEVEMCAIMMQNQVFQTRLGEVSDPSWNEGDLDAAGSGKIVAFS